MKHNKLISAITLSALVIAAVFGAVIYHNVQAAGPAQAAFTNQVSTTLADTGAKGFGHGMPGGYSNAELATALGISEDELNTAYQTANAAMLKQAVSDGLITQAQADEITANGSTFPLGGRWIEWLNQQGLDYDTFLADALGINVEQLQAAYLQAYNARIDQAVTDGNLTQEQADLMKGRHALYANQAFQTSLQSAFESAVKQAVTDNVITQAQADQILANDSGTFFAGPKDMGGPGMHGGPRGMNGPNDFGRNDRPGNTTPDTTTPDASTTTP